MFKTPSAWRPQIHHTSTDYGWIVGPAYALWFHDEGERPPPELLPTPRRLPRWSRSSVSRFLKAGFSIYEGMSK